MNRDELDKAIEKIGSLFLFMKRDDSRKSFLRDSESGLGEILEQINRFEKTLTSSSDMDQDDDQAQNLYEKSLQCVEDVATKASTIIDNNRNWLRDFKMETSTFPGTHKETLRKVTANFHRGPAMFCGGTLKRNIEALSEEIDDMVENQVTRRREICTNLGIILEADQTDACGQILWDQLRGVNEEISESVEVIEALEQKISRLDEGLNKLIE